MNAKKKIALAIAALMMVGIQAEANNRGGGRETTKREAVEAARGGGQNRGVRGQVDSATAKRVSDGIQAIRSKSGAGDQVMLEAAVDSAGARRESYVKAIEAISKSDLSETEMKDVTAFIENTSTIRDAEAREIADGIVANLPAIMGQSAQARSGWMGKIRQINAGAKTAGDFVAGLRNLSKEDIEKIKKACKA